MKAAILTMAAALSGCATLIPNSVRPEFEHMSHLTQHQPFTSDPTRYDANIASVAAHWNGPHNFYVEVAEGVDLDQHYVRDGRQEYGEVLGPREEFTMRVGWILTVKK